MGNFDINNIPHSSTWGTKTTGSTISSHETMITLIWEKINKNLNSRKCVIDEKTSENTPESVWNFFRLRGCRVYMQVMGSREEPEACMVIEW